MFAWPFFPGTLRSERSTCPSFRVIWPCSLQPMNVLLHRNTWSPARTTWAKAAGKKPTLSSITPWGEKTQISERNITVKYDSKQLQRSYLLIEGFDSENSILIMFVWTIQTVQMSLIINIQRQWCVLSWCGGGRLPPHTLVLALLSPWFIFRAFVPRSGPLPRSYNLRLDFL